MPNATGKESRKYDTEELLALAGDSAERKAPEWVTRALLEQASCDFFPHVRG